MRTGKQCICTPPWQAFYFDARAGKKIRKQFRTKAEAMRWRREHLQRLYKLDVAVAGQIDKGYALLRKAMAEFDAALLRTTPTARSALQEAFAHLYRAEDAIGDAMRKAVTS